MVKTAVVALDSAESAEAVARVAADYASALSAKLYLLHVAPPHPDFIGYPAAPAGPGVAAATGVGHDVGYREAAADRLRNEHREIQALSQRLGRSGLVTEALMIQGDTSDKIVAQAERLGADLLIVGSRGTGLLGELFLGSTSRGVVRKAPCPVLVVPTDGA